MVNGRWVRAWFRYTLGLQNKIKVQANVAIEATNIQAKHNIFHYLATEEPLFETSDVFVEESRDRDSQHRLQS